MSGNMKRKQLVEIIDVVDIDSGFGKPMDLLNVLDDCGETVLIRMKTRDLRFLQYRAMSTRETVFGIILSEIDRAADLIDTMEAVMADARSTENRKKKDTPPK